MKIVLFILAIAFSIYWTFFKKDEEEEGDDFDPSVIKDFLTALGFALMVFFSGWFVFREGLFLWFIFYTGILFVIIKGLAEKENKWKIWSIGFVIVLFIFCWFRAPIQHDSFMKWVGENKQLHCPNSIHCVKITTYIDANDHLKTKAEVVPLIETSLNWYLMFATGKIIYEDSNGKEVLYKGINIAGWWIETTD